MLDDPSGPAVTIWLDPVCPYSWNTARWLKAVADKTGLAIEWRLMSLAVLNKGRDMPPKQQSRMRDSERIGRLMAAIRDQHGKEGLAKAYFAFAERYLDQSEPVDDKLVAHVLDAVKSWDVTAEVLSDPSWDELVLRSHQAGQEALGETGGSPITRINGHAFFGPVLTAPPDPGAVESLFDAVAALAAVPQFSQLQRPRGG
ncbi:DsbA family protein [Mycobacterium sp. TY814]|uniref:mycothiol-dependent nitroreductase Rv2466c family protein n=1 Tax=unclassified Mycobacterium TaxID=2642494 RepID=UPI0027428559|nr:DsbA family protein [Mycobacterium sp. TY814]MDP7723211.1 DsbA family protein [Mycobacterium sp. TY814]